MSLSPVLRLRRRLHRVLRGQVGPRWESVRAFCLFVGYGGSGHSALGSILDAHPHAVVSHELDAMGYWTGGHSRAELFADIAWTSRFQARRGRRSPRAGRGSYDQRLPGQGPGDLSRVTLLGDKKGAGTTRRIAEVGDGALAGFEAFVGVPVRVLHVIRNPWDIVATGLAKGRGGFSRAVPVVARARERHPADAWLDVYHEDLLADPRSELARVLEFLGLPLVPEHVEAGAAHLWPSGHRRRHEVRWPPGLKDRVEAIVDRYDFLSRYTWDS